MDSIRLTKPDGNIITILDPTISIETIERYESEGITQLGMSSTTISW